MTRRRARSRRPASAVKTFTRSLSRDKLVGGREGATGPAGRGRNRAPLASLLGRLRRLEIVMLYVTGRLHGDFGYLLDAIRDLHGDTKDVTVPEDGSEGGNTEV